jgi:hypothetical protein
MLMTADIAILGKKLTAHAATRMSERALTHEHLEAALVFGREIHTRGVTIYAVGQKEVRGAQAASIDISKFEGIQVLCERGGDVVTIYRNLNLRGLRPHTRTRSDRYLRNHLAA